MSGNNFFPKRLEQEIPYTDITLEEAIYILKHNSGKNNRFDGDKQAVVIEI